MADAATITVAIKAIDQLSPVLKTIDKSLSSTGSSLTGLTPKMNTVNQGFTSFSKAATAATAPLKAISTGISGLGAVASAPAKAVGGLVDVFGKLGLAGLGVQAVTGTVGGLANALGFGLNNQMEQASASINAFTKDSAKTAEIIAMVREEAAKTPFSFQEMTNAAAGLLPVTKASGESLQALMRDAEVLSASNPMQGFEGAVFSLREAVTGDFTSIIERFNLSRSSINKWKEEGVPNIEIVRRAMNEMGFDADLVAAKSETLEGRWSTFQDTVDTLRAKISQPIFNAAKEGLIALGNALDDNMDALTGFANLIAGGFTRGIEMLKSGFTAVQALVAAFTRDTGAMGIVIDKIRDIFGDTVADAIEPFVQAFRDAIPAIKDFVGWVGSTLISTLSDLRTWLGDRLKDAFDWWTGTAWPAVQRAAQTVQQWMESTLFPTLGRVKEWLQDKAGAAVTWWTGTAWPSLQAAWGEMTKFVEGELIPKLNDLKAKFDDTATAAMGLATATREGLAPALAEAGAAAERKGAWDDLHTAWGDLRAAGDDLKSVFDGIVGAFRVGTPEIEGAGGAAQTTGGRFELFASFVKILTDRLKDITSDIRDVFTGIKLLGDAFNTAGKAIDNVGGKLKELKDNLASGQGLLQTLFNLGANAGASLRAGVASQDAALQASGAGAGQAITKGAAEALDAHSPSKVFMVLGQDVTEGLNLGVLESLPKVKTSGAQLGAALIDGARGSLTLNTDLTEAIKAAATKYGIDWQTAIKVAMSEGGVKPGGVGDSGSSFGPFQLHKGGIASGGNSGSGLGDSFQQLTGLDPADIQSTWAQIDFAMQNAAKNGWGAWHGAAAAGISDWQGIDKAAKGAVASTKAVADTYGTQLVDELRDYSKSVDKELSSLSDKLDELTISTGEKLAENGRNAIDTIVGIVDKAQDEFNRLGGSLADPQSFAVQERALQDSINAQKAALQEQRADREEAFRLQQALTKADADFQKAVGQENLSFQKSLAAAKTAADKASLEQRHADRLADLATGKKDDIDSLNERYAQQQADQARTLALDTAQKEQFKALDSQLTEFRQAEAVKQRDAAIAAAQQAADENFKKITDNGEKERAKLISIAQAKLADARTEFLDKLPQLTGAAQEQIDKFLTNVDGAIGGAFGGSLTAVEGAVSAVGGGFTTMAEAAAGVAEEFKISIGAANEIVRDQGKTVKEIFGDDIPDSIDLTDEAVEAFAHAFRIWWDDARAILTKGGQIAEVVMGKDIPGSVAKTTQALGKDVPTATGLANTALGTTRDAHVNLIKPVDDVTAATKELATDGFGTAKDAATQISAVLQQLNDKMPGLNDKIREFIKALGDIPRDIQVNVNTNMSTAGGAGGGGGGGGSSSGGGGGGGDSGGISQDFLSNQSNRADLRDQGFAVGQNPDGSFYAEKRAMGGPVRAGGTYLIGEKGPELLTLGASGRITPNGGTWNGGGAGFDYDQMAQAIVRNMPQPVVKAEDLRSVLLRIGQRNGGSVGLT